MRPADMARLAAVGLRTRKLRASLSALGIAIGTHVFHAHCDPELSASCMRHHEKMLKRKMNLTKSALYAWPNAKPTED